MNPSPIHEVLVAEIVSIHGAKVARFKLAMRELFEELEPFAPDGCECEGPCTCRAEYAREADEWAQAFNFKPDAWKIDDELHAVVCWEVNITAQPEKKIAHYVEAWWALDEVGYGLHLINVDGLRVVTPVDLMLAWSDRRKAGSAA